MSPEKWLEVKEIFDAARALPAAERKSFIDEKCADADLRAEVAALLDSADEAEDFVETPALTRVSRLAAAEKLPSFIGRRIGAYLIEKELGRGGMGAVFLASCDDCEVDKKVAVKIIKHGFGTAEPLARFRRERQILAALEHPNITRLIDGGSMPDGRPYLVMDYVEGLPLGKYCAAHCVPLEERLAIFLKICAAVGYAHGKLIIHRDLKPSNILVSKNGEPKLLDFGIAKLTAPDAAGSGEAAPAARVMTPEYASPEQVTGRPVTPATDVYSLGVILYELLTGRRPFRLRTNRAAEISRILTAGRPAKPSAALRRSEAAQRRKERKGEGEKGRKGDKEFDVADSFLPFSPSQLEGALDAVILKAMHKNPERRYSSVEELAEAVRRCLTELALEKA